MMNCPEIPFFGANYPDACCIAGYLWDLDSCDVAGGPLGHGGDDPCPFCHAKEYLKDVSDDLRSSGKKMGLRRLRVGLRKYHEMHGWQPEGEEVSMSET
jgi:hypothetical protein